MKLRVAIAQVATLPAYATATIDFLREPAPFDTTDTAGTGYLSLLLHHQPVMKFMEESEKAHREDLDAKLAAVCEQCSSHKVDILIFPEYSIPPALLPRLVKAASDGAYTIVAGTHIIRTNPPSLDLYNRLGILEIARDPTRFTRRALCPVIFPTGQVVTRVKSVASKWEGADLVVGEYDALPLAIPLRDGNSAVVDLRICIDALGLGGVRDDAQFLVVTAMSPTTDPFETLFSHALLNELPSAIANSALWGGSHIRTAPSASVGVGMNLQSLRPAEEALLIVAVDLSAQFQKRGTVKTNDPGAVVARKPFLFPGVPGHAELLDLLATAMPFAGSKEGELEELAKRTDVPRIAREQLSALLSASRAGTATPADVRLLLDGLPLPADVVPFWNRCLQCLEEANTVLGELLVEKPADQRTMDAIQRVGRGLERSKALASPLLRRPSPVRSTAVDAAAPFVDRDFEFTRLTAVLGEKAVVMLRGLPGIGKKTLVSAMARESFPLRTPRHVYCVPGMEARQLLDALSAAVELSPEQLRDERDAAKRRVEAFVVVHDVEHSLGRGEGSRPLLDYLEKLSQTGSKIILLATRQADAGCPVINLSRLSDADAGRIFEYFSRALGVTYDGTLAPNLHGYPLAAKLAAHLLREGRREGFDRLRFLKQIREEVVRLLLEDVALSEPEKRAIEALSIFRRPIPAAARQMLGVPDIESAAIALESKFLIERDGELLFVMPLVREVAVETWLPPSSASAFHRAAADYYLESLGSSDPVLRYAAREEAIYHFSALRDFERARALGADWTREARSASRDLYQRRSYRQALEVCEQILKVVPTDPEILVRALLAAGRLKDWRDGGLFLERLRRLGSVPVHALTGYGEALLMSGIEQEGRALVEEAAEVHPGDAYAAAALADVNLARGDLAEAEQCAARALSLDPRSFRALEVSSKIARRLGNHETALRFARRAMEISPSRAENLYNKAMAKLKKTYDGRIPPELLE